MSDTLEEKVAHNEESESRWLEEDSTINEIIVEDVQCYTEVDNSTIVVERMDTDSSEKTISESGETTENETIEYRSINKRYVEEESSDETEVRVSDSNKEVSLIEKTRKRERQKLKTMQCNVLRKYFYEMEEYNGNFNWYRRLGKPKKCGKPKYLEDFPCKCNVQEKSPIPNYSENACKGEPTTQKITNEKSETSSESSSDFTSETSIEISSNSSSLDGMAASIIWHKMACQINRICLYFSNMAEYFIEEKVDPALFLYIPLPEDLNTMDYNYNILQENRKITILKLEEGLRLKLEKKTDVHYATIRDRKMYKRRNKIRKGTQAVLCKLLNYLVTPYKIYILGKTSTDDDSTFSEDKRRYELAKATRENLRKKVKRETLERTHRKSIDDAILGDYYLTYESYLKIMGIEKVTENNTWTDEDDDDDKEDEMDRSFLSYVKYLDSLQPKKEPDNSEKDTEEPEGEKKTDVGHQSEEQDSKRKDSKLKTRKRVTKRIRKKLTKKRIQTIKRKNIIGQSASELRSKRKKGNLEEETYKIKPKGLKKMAWDNHRVENKTVKELETGNPSTSRQNNSDQETEELDSERKQKREN